MLVNKHIQVSLDWFEKQYLIEILFTYFTKKSFSGIGAQFRICGTVLSTLNKQKEKFDKSF